MKVFVRSIVTSLLVLVSNSCAYETPFEEKNGVVGPISVAEFFHNEKKLVGVHVKVRGYLIPMGGLLELRETNYSVTGSKFPLVLINDTSPNEELSSKPTSELYNNCTNRFAELEGVGGSVPGYYDYGIGEIIKITVFDSGEFIEPGIVCYDASMQ
jgi:hypothetical protein